MKHLTPVHTDTGVILIMTKKRKRAKREICGPSTRLDPEKSLTPKYDSTGIRTFPVADKKQMGFQVLDDFTEEHIQ